MSIPASDVKVIDLESETIEKTSDDEDDEEETKEVSFDGAILLVKVTTK